MLRDHANNARMLRGYRIDITLLARVIMVAVCWVGQHEIGASQMLRRNRQRKPYRIEIEQHGVVRNATLTQVHSEFGEMYPQLIDALMDVGLGETITIGEDAIFFTRFLS
jgi:hypothetical protein